MVGNAFAMLSTRAKREEKKIVYLGHVQKDIPPLPDCDAIPQPGDEAFSQAFTPARSSVKKGLFIPSHAYQPLPTQGAIRDARQAPI